MLTIIIGIVIFGLLCFLVYKKLYKFKTDTLSAIFIAACLILLCSIPLGLFIPLYGYEENAELVKEVELVTLSNTISTEGHGNLLYVSVSSNNVYSYRYEVEDNYGISGNSYKIGIVSKNVTEVESKDCKDPVLKVYKRKGKKGLFTFAFFQNETEYVFYVPEGSIVKEIVLN